MKEGTLGFRSPGAPHPQDFSALGPSPGYEASAFPFLLLFFHQSLYLAFAWRPLGARCLATGMTEVPAVGGLSEPQFPYLKNGYTTYFTGIL